jgi:hypothetical protein
LILWNDIIRDDLYGVSLGLGGVSHRWWILVECCINRVASLEVVIRFPRTSRSASDGLRWEWITASSEVAVRRLQWQNLERVFLYILFIHDLNYHHHHQNQPLPLEDQQDPLYLVTNGTVLLRVSI